MTTTTTIEFHNEADWRSAASQRGLMIGTSRKTGETVAYTAVDGKTFVCGRVRKIGCDGRGGHTAIQAWLTI